MIFLLKFLLALVGLVVIGLAFLCFFSELTEALGLFAGLIGAAFVFLVLQNDGVMAFLGITNGMVDDIAFGAMVGGGIICQLEMEKLGAAMITAGWVAVGLIFMQVIPIPFIAELVSIVTLPFTVACVPLLFALLLIISIMG